MELPILSWRKIIKKLNKAGFKVVKQRGSHIKLKKTNEDGRNLIVTVPRYSQVSKRVLKNILRQAEMELEEFLSY